MYKGFTMNKAFLNNSKVLNQKIEGFKTMKEELENKITEFEGYVEYESYIHRNFKFNSISPNNNMILIGRISDKCGKMVFDTHINFKNVFQISITDGKTHQIIKIINTNVRGLIMDLNEYNEIDRESASRFILDTFTSKNGSKHKISLMDIIDRVNNEVSLM